ncbi:hypothetical protein Scep_006759 [Stephania cephalantha]|uniref:Uncharacterized protein n=1 Tax=Stephania cephalantha TaxID=152367 RepID=A0AAP0K8R3_9MAGN
MMSLTLSLNRRSGKYNRAIGRDNWNSWNIRIEVKGDDETGSEGTTGRCEDSSSLSSTKTGRTGSSRRR